MALFDNTARHEAARAEVIEVLEKLGYTPRHTLLTGSAYYGSERPGDFDVLVWVGNKGETLRTIMDVEEMETLAQDLEGVGFKDCSFTAVSAEDLGYDGSEYGTIWAAARRGSVNIIYTYDHRWFIRAAAATELTRATAVRDNVVPNKADTVEVFRICRFEEE